MICKLKMLSELRANIPTDLAITLYKSLILPAFDYCDIIYDILSQRDIFFLQKLQNGDLRCILKKDKYESVARMHGEANLEWLDVRRSQHSAHWAYKAKNNLRPEYICNKFEVQQGRTRAATCGDLMMCQCNNESAKGNIVSRGSICYNQVPLETREVDTLNKFKNGQDIIDVFTHHNVR